jgi:hypothetical protein
MKISTRTHGLLDYLTVGTFLALPRLLGFSSRLTNAMTTLALGKLGYAMMTKHELGLVKLIPMKTHLVLDALGGATLAALPFILDEDDAEAATICGTLGLFDIVAAPLTETHMRKSPRVGVDHRVAPPSARPQAERREPHPQV